MTNLNEEMILVLLEEEIGGLDFTGVLEKDGFNNDYNDIDELEDDLITDFLIETNEINNN